MNDLTPCIVCYESDDKPGMYTEVMTRSKAMETALSLAAQGYKTIVYSLNFLTCYNGAHLANGSV